MKRSQTRIDHFQNDERFDQMYMQLVRFKSRLTGITIVTERSRNLSSNSCSLAVVHSRYCLAWLNVQFVFTSGYKGGMGRRIQGRPVTRKNHRYIFRTIIIYFNYFKHFVTWANTSSFLAVAYEF